MPKLKTSRAILKRFKITSNKKVIRKHAGKSHLLAKKTSLKKMNLSKKAVVDNKHAKNIISATNFK
uniref:ribosomal protein L35 n=1 Tax=Madagascaria erythrocladioides TaxID=753684 RepID=UPI001BEFC582|nr:ribosomal protein L35 [Madagascaria erythrocladioides]QUE29109.1 ribosomal protein L35 [Madagascaria erythrocladioides]UNJ16665.1 ribosomal protein L35 [Madagascaria erythrocladioides]